MVGLARCSIAGEFRVDPRLAFLGMGERFHDQRSGSFSHDESIPVPVERARRPFRLIVEFAGKGAQRTEARKDQWRDARIGADHNDRVGLARANAVQRLTQRMGARGAGR